MTIGFIQSDTCPLSCRGPALHKLPTFEIEMLVSCQCQCRDCTWDCVFSPDFPNFNGTAPHFDFIRRFPILTVGAKDIK